MATDDVLKEGGKVTQLLCHLMYFGTEVKRRVKLRVHLLFTLCVGTGPVACYSNKYITTYVIRNGILNNGRKVCAISILPITFILYIYK